MTRSLARRYLAFAASIALTAVILGVFSGSLVRAVVVRITYGSLAESALLVERAIASNGPGADWDELADRLGGPSLRLSFIRDDGVVLGDSRADPATLENHANREEVRAALGGRRGEATRRSASVGEELAYVSLPVRLYGDTAVVVRVSSEVANARVFISRARVAIAVASLLVLVIVTLLSYLAERRMIDPIQKLQRAALAYSEGRFDYGLHISFPPDLAQVAASMSTMAGSLKERLGELGSRTAELEAVLAGMVDPVIVLDARRKVRSLNASAERLARGDSQSARGRFLLEVLHNSDLDEFARQVLESGGPQERAITMDAGGKLHFQAHGTRLDLPSGIQSGARQEAAAIVLVLHDMSQIRRLDEVRRDFVANVSHELKTPITAIKGYLETLREGALDDPTRARQFTETASRHADRLGAIVDDLLSLSALEEREGALGQTERCDLGAIARAAMESRSESARRRNQTLTLQAEEGAATNGNPRLLEQAIVNLVDNAVKYTDPGGSVTITVRRRPPHAEVTVADTGIGISEQDLPRIFERFYRVDKARSRDLGGTGLGLSVVKRIALAHGGSVGASSSLGKGSSFVMLLPLL